MPFLFYVTKDYSGHSLIMVLFSLLATTYIPLAFYANTPNPVPNLQHSMESKVAHAVPQPPIGDAAKLT